jgi:hypothetical protein
MSRREVIRPRPQIAKVKRHVQIGIDAVDSSGPGPSAFAERPFGSEVTETTTNHPHHSANMNDAYPLRLRLNHCQFSHLMIGCGNHALWIGGQDILRALVVKETVQCCEPESQPPPILRVTEDLENLSHFLAWTMVCWIEAVQRQAILLAVLDRKDLPVAFPIFRLHAQIGRAEPSEARHFDGWQKIATAEDGRFGLDSMRTCVSSACEGVVFVGCAFASFWLAFPITKRTSSINGRNLSDYRRDRPYQDSQKRNANPTLETYI